MGMGMGIGVRAMMATYLPSYNWCLSRRESGRVGGALWLVHGRVSSGGVMSWAVES